MGMYCEETGVEVGRRMEVRGQGLDFILGVMRTHGWV